MAKIIPITEHFQHFLAEMKGYSPMASRPPPRHGLVNSHATLVVTVSGHYKSLRNFAADVAIDPSS